MNLHDCTCTILCINIPHYMHPEFPANGYFFPYDFVLCASMNVCVGTNSPWMLKYIPCMYVMYACI